MQTETVDVHEAQTRLPELISLVIAGTEVILTGGATPRVRLVPIAKPRVAELHKGAIITSVDFDAPLPDDFWLGTSRSYSILQVESNQI